MIRKRGIERKKEEEEEEGDNLITWWVVFWDDIWYGICKTMAAVRRFVSSLFF